MRQGVGALPAPQSGTPNRGQNIGTAPRTLVGACHASWFGEPIAGLRCRLPPAVTRECTRVRPPPAGGARRAARFTGIPRGASTQAALATGAAWTLDLGATSAVCIASTTVWFPPQWVSRGTHDRVGDGASTVAPALTKPVVGPLLRPPSTASCVEEASVAVVALLRQGLAILTGR